jgi:hypothetical protein
MTRGVDFERCTERIQKIIDAAFSRVYRHVGEVSARNRERTLPCDQRRTILHHWEHLSLLRLYNVGDPLRADSKDRQA